MAITKWKTMRAYDPDNNPDDVRELQGFLSAKFSFLWGKDAIVVDGKFGGITESAVEME